MPLTALDPITALIVIDLQKGIVSYPVIDPISQVVDRTRRLIDAFRAESYAAGSTTARRRTPSSASGRSR